MSTALAAMPTQVNTKAMPSALRRMVAQWAGNIAEGGDAVALAKLHASTAVQGIRATGEGGTMGALLGAFHAISPTGLDVKIPSAVPVVGGHKVPMDAVGALAGLMGSIGAATAPHGIGPTVGTLGVGCAAVYGFRSVSDLITKMRAAKSGATPGGGAAGPTLISKASFGGEGGWADGSKSRVASRSSFAGEDPILKAARDL